MGQVYFANEDGSGLELITFDDDLSFKNFVNQNLSHRADDFDNKVIYASQFYQELGDEEVEPRNIFGRALVNTTFIKCNLDNVKLL